MIFETWEQKNDLSSHISLVVFDMNQWYKAQMPDQCYDLRYSLPFINFVLLDRISERRNAIMDMRIRKDTIQQFLTFNLSEEYSYPSSLSFGEWSIFYGWWRECWTGPMCLSDSLEALESFQSGVKVV